MNEQTEIYALLLAVCVTTKSKQKENFQLNAAGWFVGKLASKYWKFTPSLSLHTAGNTWLCHIYVLVALIHAQISDSPSVIINKM